LVRALETGGKANRYGYK